VGLAALVFGLFFLGEHCEPKPGRFDLSGFLLACTGFPLLLFALSEGATLGWNSPRIVLPAAAGAVLLAALIYVELHRPEPMLQLRVLRNRLFAVAAYVQVC